MRPVRLGMLREGLRARARLHAAVLAAAALVVAAAVVGAVFAGGAEESILRSTVAAASTGASGLHVIARNSPDDDTYPADAFVGALRDAPAAGRWAGFPTRIPSMTVDAAVRTTAATPWEPSRLVWRDGECAHLTLVSGRCPSRTGEAIVSRRTVAEGVGWRVGAAMSTDAGQRLRVVGIYRPVSEDDPFWFGFDYFDGGLRSIGGGGVVLAADTVFTSRAEFTTQVPDGVHASVDYPVDPDQVVVGDGSGLLRTVGAIRRSLAGTPFELSTGLAGVLRSAQTQRRYVAQGSGLVALQLGLLGTAVLFFVVLDLAEGRRREIALAKLRGQSAAAVARFALAEPLAVLLVALPVGVLLGWLAGVVLGALVLRPGTPVPLPLSALAAAGLALAGAALAAVLSTAGVLRRPVLEQWSDAERPPGRAVRVLQPVAAVLALAGAGVLLLAGARGAPTAVLVPALLLVAVALAGVPAAVLLARRLAPRSRATGRIARFLVVRRLGRSRAARRSAVLLVATLGLATFAIGGQSVLAGNRLTRAQTELGADRVVSVAPDGTTDPLDAVRRADPSGIWAMAAATWLPDGGQSVAGTVLAVDPSRLAAVGLPVTGGLQDPALAERSDAAGARPITLTGDRLVATLTASALSGDRPPDVLVVVRTAAGRTVRVDAGLLPAGTHRLTAAVPCGTGCTFRGLVWTRSVLAERPVAATVRLTALAVERDGRTTALPLGLGDRSAWRAAAPVSESSDRVVVTAAGVEDSFRVESGEGGVVHADTRLPLPVVVSPGGLVSVRPDDGWRMTDEFGGSVAFTPVARTAVLPVVLDQGVLADVRALDRELTGFPQSARWQVWLGPGAPADAAARLARAGLVVGSVSSVGDRVTALSREGPALAFSLLTALGGVAAALAVLATAVSAGAGARSRTREAAAMRLIGVPRSAVVRAAVGEQVALLAVAALLALPAGIAAALLVMPLVRETASPSPVPLDLVPHPVPVLVLALVYGLVVGAVGAATGRAVVSTAGPERLREVDG